MNTKFIIHDFISGLKQWLRSKGTVFWTLMFPILLILLFGAIFSGVDEVEIPIAVQNLDADDETGFTEGFIENLGHVSALDIKTLEKGEDVDEYMKDEDISGALIIPEGFGKNLMDFIINQQNSTYPFNESDLPFNLTFIVDPTDQNSVSILRSIVVGIIYESNLQITGGEKVIGLEEESSLGKEFEYIDFFIPGIIGLSIMTSMVYGSIERNTKYRKDGILRKLLTMPVTRAEWILSKMLFMLVLSFISTFVIIIVGVLVWGLSVKISIFFFVIIISTSFLFSGMGMIIGRFVKEEESADMAGGAITFPMMFLAGTFFPLDQMPDFLQAVAQVLPLYYVNEGLRNAMIYADLDKTLFFSAFVIVFALVFFIIGVLLTKWKED
jgi:ABC-2 type transport system permease protein